MHFLLLALLTVDPAQRLTVADLSTAYKRNEIAADLKFKDKPLSVRGTVFAIGRDVDGNAYVALVDTRDPKWVVRCFPNPSDAKLAALEDSKPAALRGMGQGMQRMGGFTVLTIGSCVIE